MACGDDQHYVVAMEKDGAYIRLVADLDDEARRLGEATLEYVDADTLEAAFNAYNEYVKTLPVAYEEEITAAPLTQEELDALAGKTLQELEDAGYEHVSSEMGENDEATYTVSLGLYEYNLLLNETYTVYQQHDDSGFIGDLRAALSRGRHLRCGKRWLGRIQRHHGPDLPGYVRRKPGRSDSEAYRSHAGACRGDPDVCGNLLLHKRPESEVTKAAIPSDYRPRGENT